MKPITDDVVHSLLQGIAERERKRPKKGAQKMSAKIIKFSGKTVKDGTIRLETDSGRRTISGLFCYVSRLT